MATVIFEERIEVPEIRSLVDFRRWTSSDAFPEVGRIDYIAGQIEVEMSPEEYDAHGGVKIEVIRVLSHLVKEGQLGDLRSDCTRVVSVEAGLSAEPDIVFMSFDSFDAGRIQRVLKAGATDRFIEVEGAPDMIAEIVSDSSVNKDLHRLPAAYFAAGVPEYWLIDARHDNLVFEIQQRGKSSFEATTPDAEGYQASTVYGRRFRLDRARNHRGHWTYDLRCQ